MKRGSYNSRKFTDQQIQQIKHELVNGVPLRTILKRESVGLERLKKEFKMANIEYPDIQTGRKPKPPSQGQIDKVIEYRNQFNVGYQRCAFALNKKGIIPITARQCSSIYELEGLYKFEHEYKDKDQGRIRYVAKMVGQIWHTDLHQIDDLITQNTNGEEVRTKQYIVAFLDDRSRYIIHASIVTNKESTTIASELVCALLKASAPARIVIDNGGEFVGAPFQQVLELHGIKDWRTQPYTPQQNGKMERWWQTYESSKGNSHLQSVVNEYNTAWRHSGLRQLTGKWITPADMWLNETHWTPGQPDEVEFSAK